MLGGGCWHLADGPPSAGRHRRAGCGVRKGRAQPHHQGATARAPPRGAAVGPASAHASPRLRFPRPLPRLRTWTASPGFHVCTFLSRHGCRSQTAPGLHTSGGLIAPTKHSAQSAAAHTAAGACPALRLIVPRYLFLPVGPPGARQIPTFL